jgi:hypothetical protein
MRLQRSLLRANEVPALRRLNTVPYAVATALLRRLCEGTPGVCGGFVRSGLSREGWTPGLSDVDPLVVLDERLSLDEERRTALEVTRSYSRLQRALPMLGELEIISGRHLAARVGNGVDAGTASSWVRLGDLSLPDGESGADASSRDLAALRAYGYHLLPWCQAARRGDPRAPFVRGRAGAKLRRSLGLPAAGAPDDAAPAEIVASALAALSAGLRPREERTEPAAPAYERALAESAVHVERRALPAPLPAVSLRTIDCLVAPTEAPERLYLVLSDDALEAERLRCIDDVLARLASPVIVDRRVLVELLLVADPLEHFTLLHRRIVFHGSDPFPLPHGPSSAALRRSVLDYAVDMLGYPYSSAWQDLTGLEFRDVLLGWFVRTAAYLADGVMEPALDGQQEYYRTRFPELAAAVDPVAGSDDPARRFAVLRALVDEICRGMSRQAETAALAAGASSSPS